MEHSENQFNCLDGIHVLVADNSEAEREMLVHVLGLYGARVSATGSARSALHAIRATKPDVLVSDISLDDCDGYCLVRELRALPAAAGGETPAVAVTGWATESDRAAALEAGFHVHLVKPVALEALVTIVATLARTRGTNASDVTDSARARDVESGRLGASGSTSPGAVADQQS